MIDGLFFAFVLVNMDIAFTRCLEYSIVDWSGTASAERIAACPANVQKIIADIDHLTQPIYRDDALDYTFEIKDANNAQAKLLKLGLAWNYHTFAISKGLASPELFTRSLENIRILRNQNGNNK